MFKMRFFFAVGALLAIDLLVAILLPARNAGAGTALRLDLPALVERSECIVEARVLASYPLEVEGMLQTEYVLSVSRTLKGEHLAYRALRWPGGVREDGSGLLIPGMPHLAAGEEVLLFLEAEGRGGLRMPTGLEQGRFALHVGPDGRKRLLRDTSALALLGGSGVPSPSGGRTVFDYADLLAAIEAVPGSTGDGR